MSRPLVHEAHFNIRMPASFVERADALAEVLARTGLGSVASVTRATVFRLALARGLAALEAEAGTAGGIRLVPLVGNESDDWLQKLRAQRGKAGAKAGARAGARSPRGKR